MVNLDGLPLSKETRAELRHWARQYDDLMKRGYRWQNDEAKAAFDGRGRRLWEKVRSELAADWEVGYFSVVEGRRLWREGR